MDNIQTFLQNYQNTLLQIFKTAHSQHGPGILYVNILSNNNGNCDTQYISVHSLSDNFNDIKHTILDSTNKAFFCLTENHNKIFIQRDID